MKKLSYLLLIGFLLFLFSGCDANVNVNDEHGGEVIAVTAMDELEDTKNFSDSALVHILEGELNRKGQAVGFHYAQLPTRNGEIIEGTESEENDNGIYEAEVLINDVKKNSNAGKSTFFPDGWDTQDVIDAINEAYEAKSFINGNTYEGLTEEGIVVRMYLDQDEHIISAFPVY